MYDYEMIQGFLLNCLQKKIDNVRCEDNERCVAQRRGKMFEFRDTSGSIEAAL